MDDYEYRVIKLHAIQSQNSSKFTGDISNNTSKFTSKTNQIRLGGAMGGLPPLASLSQTVFPPKEGCLVPGLWVGNHERSMRLS